MLNFVRTLLIPKRIYCYAISSWVKKLPFEDVSKFCRKEVDKSSYEKLTALETNRGCPWEEIVKLITHIDKLGSNLTSICHFLLSFILLFLFSTDSFVN